MTRSCARPIWECDLSKIHMVTTFDFVLICGLIYFYKKENKRKNREKKANVSSIKILYILESLARGVMFASRYDHFHWRYRSWAPYVSMCIENMYWSIKVKVRKMEKRKKERTGNKWRERKGRRAGREREREGRKGWERRQSKNKIRIPFRIICFKIV